MKHLPHYIILAFLCFILPEVKANEAIAKNRQEHMEAAGIGDFIKTVVNGVLDIGRPVWGSYTVSGQNNSAPIALYKRTTFEKDKDEIIKSIQIEESDFQKVYKAIFLKGTNENTYTLPASTGSAQDYESRATFAKNAAFVLVLGVDQNGNPLNQYQKDALALNALFAIKIADDPMNDDWFKKSTRLTDGGWGQETQLIRSIELINYFIALDLVRTPGYGWNTERDHADNPRTVLENITCKVHHFDIV